MSEKIFKNRITQETPNTIKQLKSLWIDMNSDKQLTPNTSNGLFAFTINPNNFVDAVKLETDFKSILSHYYHWRYGSKWRNLKHIQVPFQGIIEKQSNGINHIHITIYQYNVEELALFIGYIIKSNALPLMWSFRLAHMNVQRCSTISTPKPAKSSARPGQSSTLPSKTDYQK